VGKSVRSGNGGPRIALRCLLLMLVSAILRIVNRCSAAFPVRTFNILTFKYTRFAYKYLPGGATA